MKKLITLMRELLQGVPLAAFALVAFTALSIESHANPVSMKSQLQSMQGNDVTVTGKVIDNTSEEPLAFAAVTVRGTTRGVSTGMDGSFRISVPRSDTTTLVVKYMGYDDQVVRVGTRTNIEVRMLATAATIETVIVTGYGNILQEAYTGSATVIGSEQLLERPVASFEDALRGLSVGTLVSSSGQPGEESVVRLRGSGSMEASNQPLYVVDGVVWDQESMTGADALTNNPLNSLNPSDIANMTILKDAASASLYGSRGANGVIVITTKQGELNNKINFTVSAQGGFSVMSRQPDLLIGREYADLWVEGQMHKLILAVIPSATYTTDIRKNLASELTNLYGDKDFYTINGLNFNEWQKAARAEFNTTFLMPTATGGYRNYDYFGADYDRLPATDWFKEITRVAPFVKVNFSFSGGTQVMRYYSSAEYFDQQGTIINSQLKRYSFRVNLTSSPKDKKIHWNIRTNVVHTLQSGPRSSGSYYDTPQFAAINLPSVVPAFLENGNYNLNFPNNIINTNNNPVASAYENIRDRPSLNLTLSGSISWQIAKWARLTQTSSLYYYVMDQKTYYNSEFGAGYSWDGSLIDRNARRTRFSNSTMLFLNQTFKKIHKVSFTGGLETESTENMFDQMGVGTFLNNDKPYLSRGAYVTEYSGGGNQYSMFSVVTKLDYSYRNKFYISGSFRQDQSSKFAPEYRKGNFWSASGAYTISNERFMKKLKAISRLRLKGSYGINGTLPNQNYQWRGVFSNEYGGINPQGLAASAIYTITPDLTWERNRIWNVGLEAKFLKNRIGLEVEYYNRISKDLLMVMPQSMTSGFRSRLQNTDSGIINNGVEITITAEPIKTKDFGWDFNFNISTLKSEYYGLSEQILDNYSRQLIKNGLNTNTFYLRQVAGIDKVTGMPLYVGKDPNTGKMILDISTSKTVIDMKTNESVPVIGYQTNWQGVPKVSGGLQTNFSYQQWTLTALFTFAWGHYVYDRLGAVYISTDGYRGTTLRAISRASLGRWNPDNLLATRPIRVHETTFYSSATTRFVVKGDYFKLKNIMLRYTLSDSFVKKAKLRGASIFVQAENLWIASQLKDFDPELTITGYRHVDTYPTSIRATAGVTVNF